MLRSRLSFFLGVVIVAMFAVHARADEPRATPATQPVISAAQAVYRNNVEMVEELLQNPADEFLLRLGKRYRSNENYPRATILHLTALRTKHNDALLEYELACDFALWGQVKLGMEYLKLSADHGYWGYSIAKDDTDLESLKKEPEFAGAMAKIKASFAVETPKHAPGMTLKVPAGEAPAQGWPVLICLHGWGSNRHDFDDAAELVASMGYVGITLDGTELMGPDSYMWTTASTGPTHDRVQAALKGLTVKTNPRKIYLHGFSQGAMHAARMLADHPDLYAGAICNSPGSLMLAPQKLADPAHTGAVVLSVGNAENPSIGMGVAAIEKLWKSADRKVHVIRFTGGHELPPDSKAMFENELKFLAESR